MKICSFTRGYGLFYIGLLLHAHQPPTQPPEIVETILRESYEPVIELLEENQAVYFSMDMTRSLAERLPKKFLERIEKLYFDQRIELVNTAAYHYLLPLVPAHIVRRQLLLNEEFYRTHFTGNDRLPGVFLPECAFSSALPKVIRDSGYRWLLADDEALTWAHSKFPERDRIPQNRILEWDECGALLQSRLWHKRLSRMEYPSGREFASALIKDHRKWRTAIGNNEESYTIIAVDFETFGHHHKDAVEWFLPSFFEEISRQQACEMASLDFIFRKFPKKAVNFTMPAGSWATEKEHFDRGLPYPLWNHPDNPFHQAWNEFMQLTFASAPENPEPELQDLLDKAFYSCSPWWATKDYSRDRRIAGWCLPYFKRIIELLPGVPEKKTLQYFYGEMRRFLAA